MSYIQYIGMVMFFGLLIGVPMWTVYKRGKLQDITQNKVLAIRLTRVGNLWFELCPYENEQAKFTKDDEEEAGSALLNKANTFSTLYPPTLHKVGPAARASFISNLFRPTVSIRAVVIPEGYPVGYMPWIEENAELYARMTDRQLDAADEQSLEKMLRGIDKLGEKQVAGGLKKSDKTWALVIGLVILLLAGAGTFLGYMNYTEMTSWGW